MYFSIRWKIALFLVLILLFTMTIANIIITSAINNYYINQIKVSQMTTANIIATSIATSDEISNQHVREIVGSYIPTIDSRVIYTNQVGKVLVDSSRARRVEGHILRQTEVRQALNGQSGYGLHDLPESGWVMYVAVPIFVEDEVIGSVFISTCINDVKQAVNYVRSIMLIISIISGIIVIFLSITFSKSLVKPIERLTKVSKRMSEGELSARVEIDSNDEIGLLGESFNSMSDQLEKIEANRLKFLGDISHDLKTPLATIKVLSESLEGQDDIEIYQEFLGDIVSEVNRMTSMVDNILELNKMSFANIPLKKSEFTYSYIVSTSIETVKTLANSKEISIEFIDESQRGLFYADEDKIKAMTLNLIENAVKYTGKGGEITIYLTKAENSFIFKVTDNGKGIPQEDIPLIFDRFYRVDKTRHRDTGGSGIGLSIVKTVVDLHRGKVEVKSEFGKGTEFVVSLPQLKI